MPDTSVDENCILNLRKRPLDRSTYHISCCGTVQKDLESFLEDPVYSWMFRDRTSREFVYSMLGKVIVPKSVVEVTEYFKEKDPYTYRHMFVVFAVSTHLISRLEAAVDFSNISMGSICHDLGKCSVPLDILQKETPLTIAQRSHIEHHSLAGFALLNYYADSDAAETYSLFARDHHECKDGSGYPAGVCLSDLMTEIVIASDIYDALLSPRPYRKSSYDNRTAIEEIAARALKGKISESVVQALVASNRKDDPHWRNCAIQGVQRGTPPSDNNYGLLLDRD